jgi:hypothetical protein
MKIAAWVLAGLILWNGLLTCVLFVGYEITVGQSFEIAALRQDLGKTRVRLSRDETALVAINKALGKTSIREHELELIVAKLIDLLTEPDEKPSGNNNNGS